MTTSLENTLRSFSSSALTYFVDSYYNVMFGTVFETYVFHMFCNIFLFLFIIN